MDRSPFSVSYIKKGALFITTAQDKEGLQNSSDAKPSHPHSTEEKTKARGIKSEVPKVMAMVILITNAASFSASGWLPCLPPLVRDTRLPLTASRAINQLIG